MYITLKERLLAALGTAIIVGLLGTALLLGLSVSLHSRIETPLALLDLRVPPPPPPARPPVERPRTRHVSGKASPPNLRNKTTPIVAPIPVVTLPVPPLPLIVAPKPGKGMATQTGASDRPGPGEGAGGLGDGTGSGGSGEGDGDDGVPPRPIKDSLKFSYLSADVQEALKAEDKWFVVGVRYRVEADGGISGCRITRSSGIAGLDDQTCRAIEQHFRFRPSRDPDGRPTWATIETTESWKYDRDDDPPPKR